MARHVQDRVGTAGRMSAVFDRCLAAQADGRPDDAALIDDGVAVSYRQLDERTTELADRLTAAGVRLDDRVVLVADNSIGHLIAAFAVWRAGASLVTIYPSSTVAELAHAIASTEPTMVIAGSRVIGAARTATVDGTVVVELADSGELDVLPGDGAGSPARPRARSGWAGAGVLHLRLDVAAEGRHAHP